MDTRVEENICKSTGIKAKIQSCIDMPIRNTITLIEKSNRGLFRNDPTLRQVTESIKIKNCDSKHVINNKTEWNSGNIFDMVLTRI